MLKIGNLCWICYQPLNYLSHGICSLCFHKLLDKPMSCSRCGLPIDSELSICTVCHNHPPPWQHLIAVTNYQPPLSQLIYRFKYNKQQQIGHILARLMLLTWLKQRHLTGLRRPNRLISVPLHHNRKWIRGFNQADLLAFWLAKWLTCQWRADTLIRTKSTPFQACLSINERKENVKNAFICQERMYGQHVAIIDDVVTTGNTVKEICQLLINEGVASIQVWCICRTC